jgi:transposase
LTRKNYLFVGFDAGGERAAIVYTILACCRLANVNPVEYLADVLPHLARRVRLRNIAAFMLARWGAGQTTEGAAGDRTGIAPEIKSESSD